MIASHQKFETPIGIIESLEGEGMVYLVAVMLKDAEPTRGCPGEEQLRVQRGIFCCVPFPKGAPCVRP